MQKVFVSLGIESVLWIPHPIFQMTPRAKKSPSRERRALQLKRAVLAVRTAEDSGRAQAVGRVRLWEQTSKDVDCKGVKVPQLN